MCVVTNGRAGAISGINVDRRHLQHAATSLVNQSLILSVLGRATFPPTTGGMGPTSDPLAGMAPIAPITLPSVASSLKMIINPGSASASASSSWYRNEGSLGTRARLRVPCQEGYQTTNMLPTPPPPPISDKFQVGQYGMYAMITYGNT